jgi:histo-blood group ABO system transferase
MKICVITIATGKYIQFVESLLEKISQYFLADIEHNISCLLFTDNEMEYYSNNIKVSNIIHKPWPEPALKKYNYIVSEEDFLKDFDYLYLFDADVGFVDKVGEEVLQDLIGVLHPYKIMEPKEVYPYEKRIQSTAYVADENHDKYYAAAFVGGKSETFLNMAKVISERVNEDEKNGIIAKWHDESHLNKYFNENPPISLSPSYMFPEELIDHPQYPFKPKIVALKKESSFNQEKIDMGQYPV